MADGSWIPEGSAEAKLEAVGGWGYSPGVVDRRHRQEEDGPWVGTPILRKEQLEVLEQREHIQQLVRAKQQAQAVPESVWLMLNLLREQLESQQWRFEAQFAALQRRLESQQDELDSLKRRHQAPVAEAPAELDAFQRWMSEHREEVARHCGRHIALHAERGILVSAEKYADLEEQLERQGVPDDQIVIEFIPPALSSK